MSVKKGHGCNEGPAIKITVLKGKSVNAKFYKGMWCQVVAWQCCFSQSGHCTRISDTGKGCPAFLSLVTYFWGSKNTCWKKCQTRKKKHKKQQLSSAIFLVSEQNTSKILFKRIQKLDYKTKTLNIIWWWVFWSIEIIIWHCLWIDTVAFIF
jgi:hypothetical protein